MISTSYPHQRKRMLITRTIICIGATVAVLVVTAIALSLYNQINETPDFGPTDTHPRSNSPPYPGGTNQNLFWFIQISDIHLSRYYGPTRRTDFQTFCNSYIDVIKPKLVLVTGDITDAKAKNKLGSGQYKDEWEMYWNTLRETNVLSKTTWLDTRGNHDAFNVISIDSQENYFGKYSVQGPNQKSSYMYSKVIETEFGKYAFSAVDSCPNPGPRRPFNFFGHLSKSQLDEISESYNPSNNMTIYFGHYPTSTVVSPYPGMKQTLRNGAAYLCGHLHTLIGLVPTMYTVHSAGNLELELADWKDNRAFRVLAIDHDMLSFTDERFQQWPIILVTNPKNAQFLMPRHEPTQRMKQSTHIRVLVFSLNPIKEVQISIDDQVLGLASSVEGPLYALPWKPESYQNGIHSIKVAVLDSSGGQREQVQPFTLDNTYAPLTAYQRFVLMLDVFTILKVLFYITFLVSVVPLFLLRYLYINATVTYTGCMWLLAPVKAIFQWTKFAAQADRKVFWSVMFYNFYVAVGPWFIGEVLEGHVGYVFVHGIYINSSFIPGSLTYLYGYFQIVFVNIPFTLYIGHCLQQVYLHHNFRKPLDTSLLQYLYNHWLFYAVILLQAYLAYSGFFLAYGAMAFFLSPMRTWSVVLFIIVRRWALKSHSAHDRTS